MQAINIAVNLTAFIVSLMLVIAAILGGSQRGGANRWFFALALITCVGAAGDTALMTLWGTPGTAVARAIHVIDWLNYGVVGITLLSMGLYFHGVLASKAPISRGIVAFHTGLAVVATAFVLTALPTGAMVWLDDSNNYHTGRLFWVYQLFLMLSLVVCMGFTLIYRRWLRRREWISLLLYAAVPGVCYVIEIVSGGLWVTYLGSAATLLMVYMNIQLELRHALAEKDAELARGRVAMMISQIQPHFIFNTLSSISEVCTGNPLAQECLLTFSEYLRVNMDSLSQQGPIPFARELEHARQYLWLEQLRFEERLAVEYDIQTEDFALPVLTLQPIVENAVRHGITRRAAGGTLLIRTEKTPGGARLTVRDDGVGFDPRTPPADGRSHTGLDNVRSRLAAMRLGELAIASEPGVGTVVTVEVWGEGV